MEELIRAYLFPFILLLIGAILAASQKDTPAVKGQPRTIKILGLGIPILRLPASYRDYPNFAGFFIILVSVILAALQFYHIIDPEGRVSTNGVYLVSASYTYEGWDPHLIDFRTAATKGIFAEADKSIIVSDLQVFAPENAAGLEAKAEVLVEGRPIAESDPMFLSEGVNKLPNPYLVSAVTDKSKVAWTFPSTVDRMVIRVSLKKGIIQVGKIENEVLFSKNWSEDWLISPPLAQIVEVGYVVNQSPVMWMDLQEAETNGLSVYEGDKISIVEVMYKSRFDSLQTVHLEGYVTKEDYNPATLQVSDETRIESAVHSISNVSKLSWPLGKDADFLVLTLVRDDKVVLDRYTIPLNQDRNAYWVRSNESLFLPGTTSWHNAFESDADLVGLEVNNANIFSRTDERAYSGVHSLVVETSSNEQQQFVRLSNFPKKPRFIMGQIYWPARSDCGPSWAQICVTAGRCSMIDVARERWIPFAFDLSLVKNDDGQYVNLDTIDLIYFQGVIDNVSVDRPYTFYIDDLVIFTEK